VCDNTYAESRPDQNHIYYADSFYSRLGMVCWSNIAISSTLQVYFFGMLFTIAFISFPDRFGRKTSLTMYIPFLVLAFNILTFSKSHNLMMVGFFILGVMKTKNSTCILFSMENCLTKDTSKALAFIFTIDSSSPLVYCFFVLCISKNTYYLFYFINAVGITAIILFLLFVKESPKWYILKGRNEDAI